jgi:hypothetical protein
VYKYYLVFGSTKIFLFESQFQFLTEESSLRHYEKGLAKGLFSFNRARIDQVWAELALWGLIGRICPVELVRILCAFGCGLRVVCPGASALLNKSFFPVSYFIPVVEDLRPRVRHMYHWPLEPNVSEHVAVLLELDQRIVVGSFYFTQETDVDFQLPQLCRLMERDLCLPADCIRRTLSALFCEGYKVVAESNDECVVLAYRDRFNESLHGFNADQSLFYIGNFGDVA